MRTPTRSPPPTAMRMNAERKSSDALNVKTYQAENKLRVVTFEFLAQGVRKKVDSFATSARTCSVLMS